MAITVPDFKDAAGQWVKGYGLCGTGYITRAYQSWNRVRDRCKIGGKYQQRKPTYIGCTMTENFEDFQFFAEWVQAQVGYSCNGYQLDKDILVAGNKVYGENTCVFVPQQLNMFLVAPVLDNPLGRGVRAQCGGK